MTKTKDVLVDPAPPRDDVGHAPDARVASPTATTARASTPAADRPPAPNAPDAAEIERRFSSVPVVLTRPLILSGIKVLTTARRFGWTAEGVERLRGLEPPLVFAANHISHADTAAIMGTLPRRWRAKTAVAAALDVFGPSSTGRSLRNETLQLLVAAGFHAFAFDRHGPPLRSLRTSVELVRHGWNLLLYPEGTRSRTGRMGPFKAGIGVLARFTGRPVVPVFVHGGAKVHPHGAFMPRPGRMIVCYGPPQIYGKDDTPDAFVERLRETVCEMGKDIESQAPAAVRVAGTAKARRGIEGVEPSR